MLPVGAEHTALGQVSAVRSLRSGSPVLVALSLVFRIHSARETVHKIGGVAFHTEAGFAGRIGRTLPKKRIVIIS